MSYVQSNGPNDAASIYPSLNLLDKAVSFIQIETLSF
jgi:hypothetical protein